MTTQIPQGAQPNGRVVYIPMTKRQIDDLLSQDPSKIIQNS